MARTRSTTLLAGIAVLAGTALFSNAAGPVAPATAQAADGCGVDVTASSRNVRRGGKVLLEGNACGASTASVADSSVKVKILKRKRWATVANAQADSSGQFSICTRVNLPAAAKLARLRVTTEGGQGATTLRVGRKGSSGCETPSPIKNVDEDEDEDEDEDSGGNDYVQPPHETGNPNCPLSHPGSTIGLTLPSACSLVGQDTASSADPVPFWGKIDCQTASRHQHLTSGGDTHDTGLGSGQGNASFRRMTVQDGDNIWGERCELGENESYGHTTLYHEGQRRVTYMSIRMGNGANPLDSDWRTVMQMKQAQSYRNPNLSPIIEMQVRNGAWTLRNSWSDIWTAPAQGDTWTRFGFDITYSADPSVGSMRMYVDLNGDGDSSDVNESSPTMHMATLRVETAGSGSSRYEVGQSIPDHLRAGIYQNGDYSCPTGCSVDVDNVQIVKG